MLPSEPSLVRARPAVRLLERERQHVLGHLQRDLDRLGVLLVRDDHLEQHGVARRGERRADLDVRGAAGAATSAATAATSSARRIT